MATVLLSAADAQLGERLQQAQVRVIVWPGPFISEAEDYANLDEAIESLFGYDWIILKNEVAASFFLERFQLRHQLDELDDLRVLAIGERTAERLTNTHLHVDVALERFTTGAVYNAIESYLGDRDSLARLNVLLPSANLTRETFERQLEETGARVDNVTAYRTTPETSRLTRLKSLIAGGAVDAVLFENSAAIEALARLLDSDDLGQLLSGVHGVCADAEVAQVANQFGLDDLSVPDEWTAAMITKLLASLRSAAAS